VRTRATARLDLHPQKAAPPIDRTERTTKVVQTGLDILNHLGLAGEFKDNETGLHVVRVSHYARIIGLAAGLDYKSAEMLSQAAPLHDVGKIGIPDGILKKPGKLNDEEWAVMRTHAEIGAQLLGEQVSEVGRLAGSVALTHHEKWNGGGYPYGLKGEEIPLEGRITALADVFDALTSERPYKDAWTVEDAVAQIQQDAGSHFDPKLVECFMRALPEILKCHEQYQEKPRISPFQVVKL
jgi:putative two-component system response regulator